MVEEKDTLELAHSPIDESCKKCTEHGASINLGWEETYKRFTRDTAQYPKEVEMEYLMIGLAHEVGEV